MPVQNLVTGACGMIGSHLVERLRASGQSVVGTYFRPTTDLAEISGHIELHELDLRYGSHVAAILARFKPQTIYHLGAQSYPTVSWDRPEETVDINIHGTVNVFEAVKMLQIADPSYRPGVVVACSSAEYGASLVGCSSPVKEDAQLLPLHPYGVSKVAADLLAYQYFRTNGIRSLRARIFNTSGPRKRGDVFSDFAKRIVELPPKGGSLRTGTTTTRRAFLHVNDTVRALIALATCGTSGQVYNISGINAVSVQDLIPLFQAVSGKTIRLEVDQSLLRPTDEPIIWGDISRIRCDTGWSPTSSIPDIVRDVYDYELKMHRDRFAASVPALSHIRKSRSAVAAPQETV